MWNNTVFPSKLSSKDFMYVNMLCINFSFHDFYVIILCYDFLLGNVMFYIFCDCQNTLKHYFNRHHKNTSYSNKYNTTYGGFFFFLERAMIFKRWIYTYTVWRLRAKSLIHFVLSSSSPLIFCPPTVFHSCHHFSLASSSLPCAQVFCVATCLSVSTGFITS